MPVKDDWVNDDFVDADDMNAIGSAINSLESGLGDKADAVHTHAADDITSGQLDISVIPTGATGSTVCIGNDSRLSDTRVPTDNTVSTNKIQDGAVTTAKLAPEVTTYMQGLIHSTGPTSQSSASSGTHTAAVASSRHRYYITAQAVTATIAAPTGSPANGWQLIYRIKDNGNAQTLNWDNVFRPIGVELPTTTTVGKTIYVGCEYNADDAKWDVLAVGEG